jgi:hypothetical protein
MAGTFGEIPFGLRDIRITPWVGTTLSATIISDVPRIRSVEMNVTRESTDLDGDDVRIATHTFNKACEGSIEAGGINLPALAVLTGGTATMGTGVSPNKINTFLVQGTDAEGYFKLEGHAYGDDAGDVHVIIWRAKASNGPNHTFGQGEFAMTACDLVGVFDASVSPSRLYTIIQNESIVVLPAPIP